MSVCFMNGINGTMISRICTSLFTADTSSLSSTYTYGSINHKNNLDNKRQEEEENSIL